MGNFITNAEGASNLKNRLLELIDKSRELRFLAGFFYFSGIRELYAGLKNNANVKLRILVGLNVGEFNFDLIETAQKENSDPARAELFLESLRRAVNFGDFDCAEFEEQALFFIDLIKKDRLIIRKTKNPNHAKLYIFDLNEAGSKEMFITGSSNLTKPGLIGQEEFNVEVKDYGAAEAKKYFDDLWEIATPITENDTIKKRMIEAVAEKSHLRQIVPFEAFVFALKNYLDCQKPEKIRDEVKNLMIKKGYFPYQYQLDAMGQALAIINEYQGVVISDVVGLGKSVIAAATAKSLGKKGVIVCPPALIGDDNGNSGWKKYKKDFELFDWEVRSIGVEKLKETLEFTRENEDYEVVIVDEAHRFRNKDTAAYGLLENICRGKKVILLTATPFNNSPADIFSLLALFDVPAKSKISLSGNLQNDFARYGSDFKKLAGIQKNRGAADSAKKQRAEKEYQKIFGSLPVNPAKIEDETRVLSARIKSAVAPVLIRRNRIDLKNDSIYAQEIGDLPELRDPEELFYELAPAQSDFYDQVVDDYFGGGENRRFRGAVYRPFIYQAGLDQEQKLKEEENKQYLNQTNLFDFMRRLLVKRFESSFFAFGKSLENFKNINVLAQKFIEKSGGHFVLDRDLMKDLEDGDEDEIAAALADYEQKLRKGDYPKSHQNYEVARFKAAGDFLAHIESDKRMFSDLLEKMEELKLIENDPKLHGLIEKIKEIFSLPARKGEPQRKIAIFTEYKDTADYLAKNLEKVFGGAVLEASGAVGASDLKAIWENFDAAAPLAKQKNDYSILVATDKLAEGFNLNRAGAVINYDIPWNPTRVIQRVGRINRIGKNVFDRLYLFNCFPTKKGEAQIRAREIAAQKMFLIHNALGEDAKIFDAGEQRSPAKLYTRINQNPEKIEDESFSTKIRREYEQICRQYPEIAARVNEFPSRVKSAKFVQDYSLAVFFKKGLGFYCRMVDKSGQVVELPPEAAYPLIACAPETPPAGKSPLFWQNYQKAKEFKDRAVFNASAASVENRALASTETLANNLPPELARWRAFLNDLLEDMADYKTLPMACLRRLAGLKTDDFGNENLQNLERVLAELKFELGDFMAQNRQKARSARAETIVAVENIDDN